MDREFIELFTENNDSWLKAAYNYDAFNYPVGLHRLRILSSILDQYGQLNGKRALDIGCGGGDLSCLLAEKGCHVTAVDMSVNMLDCAREKAASRGLSDIEFHNNTVDEIPEVLKGKTYDIVVAFGLIGYLENDGDLFDVLKSLVEDNGILLISFRNRLFNMTSISPNTEKEIESGNAIHLINEIDHYYEKGIGREKTKLFIKLLRKACDDIEKAIDSYENWEKPEKNFNEIKDAAQPRQSTPEEVQNLAKEYGYELINNYGVHPHLLLPRTNTLFPPEVFNRLSDALIPFEEEPISMVWSSVFISELKKQG